MTNGDYRPHFLERLGFLGRCVNPTDQGSIWFHAVSVGEIASAAPLILKFRSGQNQIPIYVSTSTIAGRKAAERQLGLIANGIFYAPIDYVSCVRRTLRAIRPALLIILETEIWPNLYAETKKSGARLVIVNGRISNRTWPRYQAAKHFFAPILALVDLVFVQSREDGSRYLQLGVATEKLAVLGNLKYDAVPAAGLSNLPTFAAQHVWIAASTVGPNERGSTKRHSIDEDDIVVETFSTLAREFSSLLLILAPRQPSRFEVVAEKLRRSGVRFIRRSTQKKDDLPSSFQLPGILLLDTIGELSSAFPLAHVAFVGGSLAPRGGHNILEPAAAAVPVVVGPHIQNFASLIRDFRAANALIQIEKIDEFLPVIRNLLRDRQYAAELGRRGHDVVTEQRGVADRIACHLLPLYHGFSPNPPSGRIARAVLASLAFLWERGGIRKRHRSELRLATQPPLPVPVISVGGITVGGAGKTPFASFLATKLRQKGHSPAILTRGYRRRSPARNLVFAPATSASPALTGDEAQIFLRAGAASVGIGTNRYETAKILLREHPATDVLLLDDGFQHARLPRDLDIVVIDGLDPFGREHVVPLGRLREPLQALRRAHVFIVTRADNDLRYQAIRERLRDYNPAPVYRTRLKPCRWRDYRSGKALDELPARRVAAFCGLGNPQNFWNTLESLGLDIVFRWAFEDHHPYKPMELQRIAHHARMKDAEILVTTEKDRMNCPDHLTSAIAPLDLAWLEIDLEMDEEDSFFAVLDTALNKKRNA